MRDDSSKSREWAARRHKFFPKTVCLAHLIMYNEPLCPNLRGRGIKVCTTHAEEIAGRVGWQSPKDLLNTKRRRDNSRIASLSAQREQIAQLTSENLALQTEINRLRQMSPAERRAENRVTDGTIYALLSGYNVKIGWTGRDLQDRLREYPPSTQLLVHFPGKRGDETRVKRRFAHLRTHGNEWFPYAPQVTEWVEQMTREHGNPDPDITCGPAKYQVPRPHADKPVVKPRGWVGGSGALPTGKSA